MITGRIKSFIEVKKLLRETYDRPIVIVETGCVRGLSETSRMGDGWSTYHWLEFCSETNSTLFSVDIDSHAIKQSQQLQSMFFADKQIDVSFIQSDSIEFLKSFDKKIDLLFLDSLDWGNGEQKQRESEQHSLNEVLSAWDKLSPTCFVLIDDVFDDKWLGKGKLSIPYLLENGFGIAHRMDNQCLLKREER